MKSPSTYVPRLERLEDRSIPGSLLGLFDSPQGPLSDLLANADASSVKPRASAREVIFSQPERAFAPPARPVAVQQVGQALPRLTALGPPASANGEREVAFTELAARRTFGAHLNRLSASAAARRVEARFSQTSGAFAFLTTTEGCLRKEIAIVANENTEASLVPRTSPTNTGLFGLTVFVFDTCAGVQIIDAEGFEDDVSMFHASPDLRSATLTGTIETLNLPTGQPLVFDVAVTWTAAGRLTSETLVERSGSAVSISHLRERPAVASGTVSDGTTNFFNALATDAALTNVESLEITF